MGCNCLALVNTGASVLRMLLFWLMLKTLMKNVNVRWRYCNRNALRQVCFRNASTKCSAFGQSCLLWHSLTFTKRTCVLIVSVYFAYCNMRIFHSVFLLQVRAVKWLCKSMKFCCTKWPLNVHTLCKLQGDVAYPNDVRCFIQKSNKKCLCFPHT